MVRAGAGEGLGTAGQGEAGRAGVCACKSVRLWEFAKQVCFEFASVAGGWCCFLVLLLWCGAAFVSFGWCCFSPSFFGNVLISSPLLAGTAHSLPPLEAAFSSLLWVVLLSF